MFLTHLECTICAERFDAAVPQTICARCTAPLAARYDLEAVRRATTRDVVSARSAGGMWRYAEALPAASAEAIVTLGEGGTPLLELPRLAHALGLKTLFAKDEGQNPTGSFKARGMSAAVTMARALGATALAAPSAGNAGGALAAYGARAGLPVHLAMPEDVPLANRVEAEECGAHVTLLPGTIADCGKWVAARAREEGWYDVSTLKEPYRVEGKKTMGYELCEQLDWTLPDVIFYPTGGGTGLVGMDKAFQEMRELGWLEGDATPRMVCVQAAGCAPMVEAFETGAERSRAPEDPHTCASGLRVPTPIGDRWMLDVLRRSSGTAIRVSDEELLAANRRLSETEGIFAAPEGGALVAALEQCVASGFVRSDDRVALFLTGTGVKYLECFARGEFE